MIRAYIEKKNYTIYFRTCCVNSELNKVLSFYSRIKIMFNISSKVCFFNLYIFVQ